MDYFYFYQQTENHFQKTKDTRTNYTVFTALFLYDL